VKLTVKSTPEDFVVEEVLRLPLGAAGPFAVYQATKRGLTTPELQQRLAEQLGVSPRSLAFPALKDKAAVTTQHFCFRGSGPQELVGEGYSARLAGRSIRPLNPGDLLGNRFCITLRGLTPDQALALAQQLAELAQEGLPNYFDQQRFGSYPPGGVFIGKAILQGDAETALWAYLAQRAPGDSPAVRHFKAFARDHWRDWPAMFEQAPRSNHRSLLTFLKDHPEDFRRAINLITPRLLPLFLAAYQSFLWNRAVSRYLQVRLRDSPAQCANVPIAGEALLVYRSLPHALAQELAGLTLPLPHHQMALSGSPLDAALAQALEEEGLTASQLKPRLLQRAYLPKGRRAVVLVPQDAATERADDPEAGTLLRVKFFLPPGSYATLVIKALAAT